MSHPPVSVVPGRLACGRWTLAAVLAACLALLLPAGCATKKRMPLALPAPSAGVARPGVPAKAPPPPPPAVTKPLAARLYGMLAPVADPPDTLFADDLDAASLALAIDRSLLYFDRAEEGEPLQVGGKIYSPRDLRESLVWLRQQLDGDLSPAERMQKVKEAFDVYRSPGSDGKGAVLVTGYFEPVMEGSLVRTDKFRYPLYRAPDDAVVAYLGKFHEKYRGDRLVGRLKNGEFVPYLSRREIDKEGLLAGRNLEIAWVADPVDLFFLHIQGSGKIRLPDGALLQVSYAQANGRPFRSVSRYLLEKGRITEKDLSYLAVKKYLREHPQELGEILAYNESYVFFRTVDKGPVGALGVTVTPGRSIATDPEVFPRGGLALLRARKPVLAPDGTVRQWEPMTRLVLNQDAGGVIKGPGRVDLFCGTGEEAEYLAGSLKERGEMFFLLPRKRGDAPAGAGAVAGTAGTGPAPAGSAGPPAPLPRAGESGVKEETLRE